MNNNLLFDFTVNKEKKTVYITREFEAPLANVWDAFTKKELLDQWTAPEPFKARTKFMEFKVGGKRFYAMVGPDGSEKWAVQKYTSISPKTNFKHFNVFTDENEKEEPTGSDWNYDFSEKNGVTTVKITVYNESFERMEMLMEGFKAGYTMTLEYLEELLKKLNNNTNK